MSRRIQMINGILVLLVLGIGVAGGAWLIANPEEARKRPHQEAVPQLVEVAPVESGDYAVRISAMGQVVPALEAQIRPQVGGEIIAVADEFVPGGFFRTGEDMVFIDPRDYELAVEKQRALLAQVEADMSLEMGRQSVAQAEMNILAKTTGKTLDNPDLALRRPQLAQAEADIRRVQSDLDDALLDLERTVIRAPFNALVTTRNATLGSRVTSGDVLARLVSTDEYWIDISVPVDDLKWLSLPLHSTDAGAIAQVILDGGRGARKGRLARLTGSLDAQGRLAQLLVSIKDPLLLEDGAQTSGAPALILGDYVEVSLEGNRLSGVVRLKLEWLRDGDTLWVFDDGALKIVKVGVLYRDRDYAYLRDGVSAGAQVVISDIPVPVDGMKLSIDKTAAP